MIYDTVIIGGGSSGLFCAANFSKKVNGMIIDQSDRPGLKLLISGGGSCNITHSGSIKEFSKAYFEQGTKIRSVLYKNSNESMMKFFTEKGLKLYTRDDGKVFPVSMKARDVLDVLLKEASDRGFQLEKGAKVTEINPGEDFTEVVFEKDGIRKSCKGKSIVIAAGGCSYPATGSDGSIFKVIRKLEGVQVTELVPALSPVNVAGYPYGSLTGLSFRDVLVEAYRDGRLTGREKGDLLFTEKNLSGPAILHISRYLKPGDYISINCIDAKDAGLWKKEMNVKLTETSQKPENFLAPATGLPKSFLSLICAEEKNPKAITSRLVADRFQVDYVEGFNKAMVTRGGISLSSVDLKTMKLKTDGNIFAIGEVLDVDGRTGGYNLQFAWSGACLAAESICKTL